MYLFSKMLRMKIYNFCPNVTQKQKSITPNNGQCVYFNWNRNANCINKRIIPITPTLLYEILTYLQPPSILPTSDSITFQEFFTPPKH